MQHIALNISVIHYSDIISIGGFSSQGLDDLVFPSEVHPVVYPGVLLPPAGQHVPHLLGGHAQVEPGGDGRPKWGVGRAGAASD